MARLLFFGRLSDMAGSHQTEHTGGLLLSELITQIGDASPELAFALSEPSVRVALNLALIPLGDNPFIETDDEVAFMPPVSGG